MGPRLIELDAYWTRTAITSEDSLILILDLNTCNECLADIKW